MKRIAALLLTVILLSACKHDPPAPPPVTPLYDVITTGILTGTDGLSFTPGYWLGKDWHPLEADNIQQAFPYGLTKQGQSLIVAGGYQGSHPHTGNIQLLPCIWRDGRMVKLPVEELTFSSRCSASDVVWYNDALYVLGDADLQPVVWKIKDEQYSVIPIPAVQDVADRRKGSNLIIWNNRICFAGNEQRQTAGGATYSAGFWSIAQDDHPVFTTIQNNLDYALCFAMAAYEDKLMITGEYAETGEDIRPALWTAAGLHPLAHLLQPATQRANEVAIDEKKNIWINIMDIQPQHTPLVWKALLNGTREIIRPEIPAQATGFCHNLATWRNEVAYAYTYMLDGNRHALVKSNKGTDTLDLRGRPDVTLHRTVIFPR